MLLYEDIISILINYLKLKNKVKFRLLNKDHLYILDTYKWNYDIRKDDNWILIRTWKYGHLETFKYLVEKFDLIFSNSKIKNDNYVNFNSLFGSLEIIKYTLERNEL